MKASLIVIFLVPLIFYSCNSSKNDGESSLKTDSTHVALVENVEATDATSFDSLLHYIENKQEIPCSYTNQLQESLKCPLTQNQLIKESNRYVVVKAMHLNHAMDSSPYYLCFFSKKTGKLISFLPIGQEAEGVEPHTIKWKSDSTFSMTEYNYEFIEDEESGAYLRGALKDSTITHYSIDDDGSVSRVIDDAIDLTFLEDKRYLTLFKTPHSDQSMIIEPACLSTCPTISFEQLSYNKVVFICGHDAMPHDVRDVTADDNLLTFSFESDLKMEVQPLDSTQKNPYKHLEVSLSNFDQLFMGYYNDSLTSINSEKITMVLFNEANMSTLKNLNRYSSIPCPEDVFD